MRRWLQSQARCITQSKSLTHALLNMDADDPIIWRSGPNPLIIGERGDPSRISRGEALGVREGKHRFKRHWESVIKRHETL